MDRLRVSFGNATESPPTAPPWSASTTCKTCGEYKPCRCSNEANLCRTLVYLAAWKPCASCGARVLYVDEQAHTDGDFLCGNCQLRRATLARMFSQIRPCRVCGKLSARLKDGLCYEHFERLQTLARELYPDQAERLVRPSLPVRAALHLKALFSTANQNAVEVRR